MSQPQYRHIEMPSYYPASLVVKMEPVAESAYSLAEPTITVHTE